MSYQLNTCITTHTDRLAAHCSCTRPEPPNHLPRDTELVTVPGPPGTVAGQGWSQCIRVWSDPGNQRRPWIRPPRSRKTYRAVAAAAVARQRLRPAAVAARRELSPELQTADDVLVSTALSTIRRSLTPM